MEHGIRSLTSTSHHLFGPPTSSHPRPHTSSGSFCIPPLLRRPSSAAASTCRPRGWGAQNGVEAAGGGRGGFKATVASKGVEESQDLVVPWCGIDIMTDPWCAAVQTMGLVPTRISPRHGAIRLPATGYATLPPSDLAPGLAQVCPHSSTTSRFDRWSFVGQRVAALRGGLFGRAGAAT